MDLQAAFSRKRADGRRAAKARQASRKTGRPEKKHAYCSNFGFVDLPLLRMNAISVGSDRRFISGLPLGPPDAKRPSCRRLACR
jgi:hypothetical protein